MLLFRQPRMRFGRAGVLPDELSTAGGSVSPLANDLPGLSGRASAQWLWTLLTPLPAGVTTEVRDDGYYGLVSPPNGVYTQTYRGLVMPASGAVQVYEATITTTVGTGPSFIPAWARHANTVLFGGRA